MARFVLPLAAGLAVAACESDSPGVQALPVVTVTVTPAELTLNVGASATLTATVHDGEGRPLADREIKWSSSAPKIVAVSSTGVVTALDVGTASIGAYSDQGVGFARAVVQMGFRVPLRRGLVRTEMGTATPACPGNEGGFRRDGGWECSHAGISRYSLDLTADQRDSPAGLPRPQVFASADGVITDICLRPPTEITCGPNGPFVQVEHRGGFLTIYAHLDPASVTLRRKTPVAQGQPLGTMGSWGADPTPWVHFELRHENQGANAASVLDRVELDGRKFRDYIVSPPCNDPELVLVPNVMRALR
jgi:hypothetical protein